MEITDPVTGKVVFTGLSAEEEEAKLEELKDKAELEEVASTFKEETKKVEVVEAEVVEEVKTEAAPNSKASHYEKLNELQAGRLISDIPLSDEYWIYKSAVDHLL